MATNHCGEQDTYEEYYKYEDINDELHEFRFKSTEIGVDSMENNCVNEFL